MKVTEYKDRIDICRKCDQFNPILVQCKVCGCLLHLKARMKDQDCPKNRWEINNS